MNAWLSTLTLAAAAPAAPGAAPAASPLGSILGSPLIFMVLMMAIIYFMFIRPTQRKEKERRSMINNIKSGDRVLFSGGIVGTVANVKDETFTVKIADNVKVEVARGAVGRVLTKDDKIGEVDSR